MPSKSKKVACKFHKADIYLKRFLEEKTFETLLDPKVSTEYDNKFKVSVYCHEVSRNGNEWYENVKELKTKENLSYVNAMKLECLFDSKCQKKNKNLQEADGWKEYFVVVERQDKENVNENMRPSRFLKVGKHLVELQTNWIHKGENKYPKIEVFSDGKRLGYILEKEGKYVANKEQYSDINEAIADLIRNSENTEPYEEKRMRYLRSLTSL